MKLKLLILFIFLFTPFTSYGQTDWKIENFQSDIQIKNTGVVDIKEIINVDFNNLDKHGIYRDIPVVYTSDNNQKHYSEVNVTEVKQDNKDGKYDLIKSGDFIRIKIGDADKTINGKHNYEINYSVKGVLVNYGVSDEFFWNVTGNGWDVVIENVNGRISIEKTNLQRSICFQGVVGSSEECQVGQNNNVSEFNSTRTLNPYEGLSVAVQYPSGIIPILVVEKPKTLFELFTQPDSLNRTGAVILISIFSVFFIWYKFGRDRWYGPNLNFSKKNQTVKPIGADETIVVEYTPPNNLRPAEIGLIIDEVAHTHDVTATIIDFAVRGFIKIKEIPKSWAFGSVDYEISFTDKKLVDKDFNSYELELYNSLLSKGNTFKISSLKQTFYKDLAQVKNKLYGNALEQKLFISNPENIRGIYIGVGIGSIVIGVISFFLGLEFENIFILNFIPGLILFGVLLMIFSKFMPRKTAKGRELYRRILGYKLFLDTSEKYRQRFFENKNLFNEVLPYTIIFGITEKFAKKFKDMDLPESSKTASWYIGTRPFIYSSFGKDINNFNNSLSSSIASTPKSSGFSSGGSSGGGFGGGGGGSW